MTEDMTLEDFFTLSELNNGLTTPSRVRELVAIMEEEMDYSGKNVGDLTRQWSTVAGAIAATDNKDCLDLFVDLNGLNSIAKWLNNAQKLFNEKSDSSVEETITHMLRAVEAFKVDVEKLVGSELWTTVKDLLVHNSPKVNDKARLLYENWEKKRVSNGSLSDNDRSGALTNNEAGKSQDVEIGSGHSEFSLRNTHLSQETSAEEKAHELTRDEKLLSSNNDVAGDSEYGMVNNSDNKCYLINDEKCSDYAKTSSLQKTTLGQPTCSTNSILVDSCSPAVSKIDNSQVELPSHEEPKPSGGKSISEIGSMNLCDEGSHIGLDIDSDVKGLIDGSGDAKEGDGQSIFHKSSSSENRWENLKEFRAFSTGIEADGKVKRRDLLTSGCDLANSYGLSKKHTDQEAAKTGKRSDDELDYGIVDPLEVARQVAIEVEREVVDYRGQSCNSSEKSPENHMRKPESPESVRGNESHVSDDSHDESKSDPDASDEDSQMQEESSSETAEAEERNDTQDMAVSQVTEVAKTEVNAEKSLMCDFDLNQVSSEDVDNPTSPVSTPVSIVSASRATPAHGLPNSPLRFEGILGWKGSASTSAFRPASPRRILENENEPHALASGSKKREAILAFDLNVAENVDQPIHHVESSAETNSRKSEHFTLDLNHASESGGGVPQDWLTGKFLPREKSVSHSSSSSKQPLSFIDLNDQPSFLNNSYDNSNFSRRPETFDAFEVATTKGNAFSIFGATVEINAKDNGLEPTTFPNGRTPELALNANIEQTRSLFGIGGPMIQYPNSLIYGYNNMPSGPATPLSSAIYGSGGPIPYVVDSRGAPVIPHIMGSGSAFPNPFSQPPFLLNMNSSIPSNGAGPSRTSFDLNSASVVVDSGSKDTVSFGQFLNLGQFRSMDEQMRSNSQPTVSSVVGQKRKEPENGWENYGLRPYTPPWK